ncbi:MAG: hypothetical protein RIQ81_2118 [Pseudomonadota bacterium]|jgi:uncharacterized caspase-like protein
MMAILKMPVSAFLLAGSLCFVLATRAIGAPGPQTEAKAKSARTIIVSVGVDRYRDGFWPTLKFAALDARNFAASIARGSDIPAETLVLENQSASAKAVRDIFERLRERVNPSDRLIVYFSGHGTLAPGGQGGDLAQVLVMHDTSSDKSLSTGISHNELRRMLDRIPARRKLLILATCHSGVGKSRLSPVAQELMAGNKGRVAASAFDMDEASSEGFLIFAAAARGETAREEVSLKGDIYTHFFLESLKAGDRDANGQVTALEAHDYARQKTWAMTRGAQRPTLEGKAVGKFDFPLSGQRQQGGLPVLTAYENSLQGYAVQVRGGEKGTIPSGFVMKEGTNIVEVYPPEGEKPVAIFSVRAREGETVALDEVVKPAPWAASLDLSRAWVQDSGARKIVPASGMNITTLRGTWSGLQTAWPVYFGIGGFQSAMVSKMGEAAGIRTESSLKGMKVEGGLRLVRLDGRFVTGSLSIGSADLSVALKDRRSGSAASLKGNSLLTGLDASAGQKLRADEDINLLAGLRYERTSFSYGEFGDVRMDNAALYVGIEARFGARARRLK